MRRVDQYVCDYAHNSCRVVTNLDPDAEAHEDSDRKFCGDTIFGTRT